MNKPDIKSYKYPEPHRRGYFVAGDPTEWVYREWLRKHNGRTNAMVLLVTAIHLSEAAMSRAMNRRLEDNTK